MAAIERVLKTERDGIETLRAAKTKHSRLLTRRARRRPRGRRADRCISNLHTAYLQKIERDIQQLAAPQADTGADAERLMMPQRCRGRAAGRRQADGWRMSVRPQWSYVQARLQARHGERLQDADWRALEAARSLDQFIERSRATSLRRFSERLNAGMSSHAIERVLRAAWRDYVAEVAGWVPPEWRPAVLWAAHLPICRRSMPCSGASGRNGRSRMRPLPLCRWKVSGIARDKSPLAPLLPAPGREARWLAAGSRIGARCGRAATAAGARSILPKRSRAHVERLGRAGRQETSAPYRRDLARKVTRLFRRHGGTPAAVFCHLALVALDLERLRGGLMRRRLFAPARAKEAA